MNTNPSAFLSNFLLGSELFDSFSFSEFQSFFSSKYTSSECVEEIRKLHALFNTRRTDARNAVKDNVKRKGRALHRDIVHRKRKRSNPVYAYPLSECVDFLDKVVKTKEQELHDLEDQLAAHTNELNKFAKAMDKVNVDDLSVPSGSVATKTKNITKLIESLE